MQDTLGNRMKKYYENNYRFYLTRRTPVIIRIDGRAFHSFTKGLTNTHGQARGVVKEFATQSE